MTSATPHPCPQCQQIFQPSRRNQRYCSSQCRIDANNDQAQKKYTEYRQHATQAEAVQHQLAELKKFLQRQILLTQKIEEVTPTKIVWNGQYYYRYDVATLELRDYGVFLYAGGGLYLVETDELIYRRVSDQKEKPPFLYKNKIHKI